MVAILVSSAIHGVLRDQQGRSVVIIAALTDCNAGKAASDTACNSHEMFRPLTKFFAQEHAACNTRCLGIKWHRLLHAHPGLAVVKHLVMPWCFVHRHAERHKSQHRRLSTWQNAQPS